MSKTSCVQPPENDTFAQIRNSYVLFCEGNHCAAALLNFFQRMHDSKITGVEQAKRKNDIAEAHGDHRTQDEHLWFYETADDLELALVGLFKREKIAEAVALLQTKAVIKVGSNPQPKYHFDKTKWFLFDPGVLITWMKDCYPDARKKQIADLKKLQEERQAARKERKQLKQSDNREIEYRETENRQLLPENRVLSSENGNSSYKALDSDLDSALDSKAEELSREAINQPQNQKQEQPNAEPLPTETRSDCAAPAPTGGLRSDSERTESSVAGAGVGEDFPSWKRYVMGYYETRDGHAVEKHLKAIDRLDKLTGEKVAAWCARCGTFQEWLRSNVGGTYAGKTNGRVHSNGFSGNGHSQNSGQFKRLEPPAVESKRPAPPVTSADRTREFFFDKVIPLDIQVHGKQTLFFNPQEHPKVFAMAWQCEWPEEEILKRLPRYWRSTNDFYRKAGYNLRLFFQNFDEFADQLSKVEMRYPLLKDVYAAQERQQARNGV